MFNRKIGSLASALIFLYLSGTILFTELLPAEDKTSEIKAGLIDQDESGGRDKETDISETGRKRKREIRIGGYFQLWLTREEVDDKSRQDVTGDAAVQESSGFSINRARLFAGLDEERIGCYFSIRLEGGSAGLLDAWGYYTIFEKILSIHAGQMVIPSTYEVLTPSSGLDFITRSRFSSEVCNWSLSRSPSSVSPFTSVQTYLRDAGAALKGQAVGLGYFLMAGNGLGSNLYIGGPEKKEIIYSNRRGAYFYGARLSYDLSYLTALIGIDDIISTLVIGGHYNRNRHPDVLYNDQKLVLDIDRRSCSGDAHISLFSRIRLTAMIGKGEVFDDMDHDGKPDYSYSGREYKIIFLIIRDLLEAGFRYDSYKYKKTIFGGSVTMISYTAGLTFFHKPHLNIKINYKRKRTTDELTPDPDDDILYLQTQFEF